MACHLDASLIRWYHRLDETTGRTLEERFESLPLKSSHSELANSIQQTRLWLPAHLNCKRTTGTCFCMLDAKEFNYIRDQYFHFKEDPLQIPGLLSILVLLLRVR